MSDTYKYPKKAIGGELSKVGRDVNFRVQEKIRWQKNQKKRRIKASRSFKEFIRFRDKHLAKGL